MEPEKVRLASEVGVRIEQFVPWWVVCDRCHKMAKLWPNWTEKRGEGKCECCGAIFTVVLDLGYLPVAIRKMPLWLKAEFRRHVFWALNGDHLLCLEHIVEAGLRERAVYSLPRGTKRRMMQNQSMPWVLPAWLLSAKNRPDLFRLIARLKGKIPAK